MQPRSGFLGARLAAFAFAFAFALALTSTGLVGCGGGIPISLRIDEFTLPISVDDTVDQLEAGLKASGVLPGQLAGIPEKWPSSLPPIHYSTPLASPPIPVDLTPDDPESAAKYEEINDRFGRFIKRIELNQLVLRVESNTTNVALPSLTLQLADEPDADPEDRLQWETIGHIPGAPGGMVTDLELEFVPGGETAFNYQVSDENKEFALRILGNLDFDTEVSPYRPRGEAVIRVVAVLTFFVEPPVSELIKELKK